ncbi:hypothetical protein [Pararhodonellum marinum]|uniref:hypothetical protein n=1 Tax=Pararhodonellum marinum TaxID=2755358 RepID=UPI00188F5691|nr:hypothetical protein [Pararhodonellum marinum]
MTRQEKIDRLKSHLEKNSGTYADSFKGEIWCMIGEFVVGNPMLSFLEKLPDPEAIHNYIDRLTSRIVMKFDPESERLGDFFWDYVENG